MNLRAVPTLLPGVLVIESEVYADARGCFLEHYRNAQLADLGLPAPVQCDVTVSQRNVLRGLHYQVREPQGKLLRVLHGAAFVAAVDMRERSPTAGKAAWLTLDHPGRALWVPPGFASGSLALADEMVLATGCSTHHRTGSDRVVFFDDPDFGIPWPVELDAAVLSDVDAHAPLLTAAAFVPGL
ncbi:MAG: dTDP-4-dehydrorhamnose 3,5-epimerase family protein [Rhodospirillales bacterium]|nr:dTDP-4-dehydrorhamnose 3,5-epimerase family protein [Rhodospirillales bacterium]